MRRLLRNVELRHCFVLFSCILLAIILVSVWANHRVWVQLQQALIERNAMLIGSLVEELPEKEPVIISAFTSGHSEARESDLALISKYGYDNRLSVSQTPLISEYYHRNLKQISIITVLGSGLLIITILIWMFRVYNRLQLLSLSTDSIMRGDFSVRLSEEGEGELALLGSQINQMTKRLGKTLSQLEQERKNVKNMVSDISHQLKTPLASLRTFNELLLDGASEDEQVRQEFLEKSLVQIERLEWLINTLLKIARLEAGIIQLDKASHNLALCVNNICTVLESQAVKKSVELGVENHQSIVNYSFDYHWMTEAFTNLIENAIKYTPQDGRVAIKLEQSHQFIRIIVSDTGVGISASDIADVFQRFYRGESARGCTDKGSGLGLALAELVVKKHGGWIGVESEVGVGTTFTVTLPVGI